MPQKKINLYWYKGDNYTNFGDELSPYIISKLFNIKILPHGTKPSIQDFLIRTIFRVFNLTVKIRCLLFSSDVKLKVYHKKIFLSLGSIITKSNYNSEVWGSGIISKKDEINGGKFYAVRGYKTIGRLKELGLKAPSVVGDPALLLPLIFIPRSQKRYNLGIIPHYVDYKKIYESFKKADTLIIDLTNPNVEFVIDQIYSCKTIISSSLHGIIVAHAYNIPALWYKFSENLAGDNIKFSDYFSSVGIVDYNPFFIRDKNLNNIIENIFINNKINRININLTDLQKQLIRVAPLPTKNNILL